MRSPALLLAILLLAGCAEPETPSPMATTDAPSGGPRLVIEPALASAASPAPSLLAPPQWASGDWWRVRITEHMSGQTFEVTRVVAGVEGDDYLVGMPHEDFVDAAMVLHLPGFGQVGRADLSYEIHDSLFAPVRFPLEDGASWETEFEGDPMTATVFRADAGVAEIEIAGDGGHILLTYDAAIGEVSRLSVEGYLEYEVVERGRGHRGVVTVPHMHDVVFNTFRFLGVRPDLDPAPPTETIRVDDTYERVSFALLAGTYLPDSTTITSGVLAERATAPDGTTFELLLTPADRPGEHAAFFGHPDPGGDWTFEHLPLGGGYVLAEGIAYHVYDVDLPSGRIEAAHAHGGSP